MKRTARRSGVLPGRCEVAPQGQADRTSRSTRRIHDAMGVQWAVNADREQPEDGEYRPQRDHGGGGPRHGSPGIVAVGCPHHGADAASPGGETVNHRIASESPPDHARST